MRIPEAGIIARLAEIIAALAHRLAFFVDDRLQDGCRLVDDSEILVGTAEDDDTRTFAENAGPLGHVACDDGRFADMARNELSVIDGDIFLDFDGQRVVHMLGCLRDIGDECIERDGVFGQPFRCFRRNMFVHDVNLPLSCARNPE